MRIVPALTLKPTASIATLLAALLLCMFAINQNDVAADQARRLLHHPERLQYSKHCDDPYIHALGVWQRGAEYFQSTDDTSTTILENDDGSVTLITKEIEAYVFDGIDGRLYGFLSSNLLQPAVQFSCARFTSYEEDALELALCSETDSIKLQALAVLLRKRAPASVDLQWQALQELKASPQQPRWKPLLDSMEACFSLHVIKKAIHNEPKPKDRYSSTSEHYEWCLRAAGVCRYSTLLPRLIDLSKSDHLDTSLTAERSLEDFPGPAGDQALSECILGWQYNAYVRACRALLRRNKPLLKATLLNHQAPEKCRYQQGIFLAECDEPAAVPLLCATVGKYQIIDVEMFDHIARLGQLEHRNIITSMPFSVRWEQMPMALGTVWTYCHRQGFIKSLP